MAAINNVECMPPPLISFLICLGAALLITAIYFAARYLIVEYYGQTGLQGVYYASDLYQVSMLIKNFTHYADTHPEYVCKREISDRLRKINLSSKLQS